MFFLFFIAKSDDLVHTPLLSLPASFLCLSHSIWCAYFQIVVLTFYYWRVILCVNAGDVTTRDKDLWVFWVWSVRFLKRYCGVPYSCELNLEACQHRLAPGNSVPKVFRILSLVIWLSARQIAFRLPKHWNRKQNKN